MINITKLEKYINLANIVHNNIYDYSTIKEDRYSHKISIMCSKHGYFEQTWGRHIFRKTGCPKCVGKGLSLLERIECANKIHNFKYDYSLIKKFKRIYDKYPIICSEHGIFEQKWIHHTNSISRCPKCSGIGLNLSDRILQAHNIHNFKYDYSLIKEINVVMNKYPIICPNHGIFDQTWDNHVNSMSGCPKCKSSKGENKIHMFLKNKNIEFNSQYKFDNCINPKTGWKLRFDFYIPSNNMCIEFDGAQHYKSVEFFGGQKAYDERVILDRIKTKYCEDNNIKLIRIPYSKLKNINETLINII